jgi:MFS family permease
MNKAMRWRALATWIALLCMSAVVVPKVMYRFHGREESSPTYSLGILVLILAVSTGLATLGTIVVWVLPVRRVWLGMVSGVIAAMGSVVLSAWFAMTFYGGFENNIGIFIGAVSVTPGSCLAGAYAGFLRSRENQAGRRRLR